MYLSNKFYRNMKNFWKVLMRRKEKEYIFSKKTKTLRKLS